MTVADDGIEPDAPLAPDEPAERESQADRVVGRVRVEPLVRIRSAPEYRGAAVARDQRIRVEAIESSGRRVHWLAFMAIPWSATLIGIAYAMNVLAAAVVGVPGFAALYYFSGWRRRIRRKRIDLVDHTLVVAGRRRDLKDVAQLGVGQDPRGARSVWIRLEDGGREQLLDGLEDDEAQLVEQTLSEAVGRARGV